MTSATSSSNDYKPSSFTNPFVARATADISNLTILSEQLKDEDLNEPMTHANGYQKLPYRSPAEADMVDHLTPRLTRMYTQSPQLPRKVYEFNPNMNHNHPAPQLHHHHGTQSPYMARKFPPAESDYTNPYNPYKPLPQQSTFSPVIRKRYQEGHLVSEDLEFRILHGNTSPIVLQRFYHQQNQLKDQKEEDQLRAIRMQSSSPNPFKSTQPSGIPIMSGSPLMQSRYQHHHQPAPTMHQRHHNDYTSHNVYESNIPQLQARMMTNGNGSIPFRHYQQQQPMYDNLGHRGQPVCPSSPQLDRLRANLEKPNFYERNQKLPVEIESSYQLDMNKSQHHNNGALIGENKTKDKGELRDSMFDCFDVRNSPLTVLTLI